MAGETGVDREVPSPQGPTNAISCVGLGGGQYITKRGHFYFFLTVFSNFNSCIGGFRPFETLGDPFPRGPQGLHCIKYLGTHFIVILANLTNQMRVNLTLKHAYPENACQF